jgi:hypothetical protein
MRLLLTAALLLLTFLPTSAQNDTALPAELAAQMDGLERFTNRARRLDTLEPVARAFPTRDEVRAYLEALYSRDATLRDLARAELFYKALWMLAPEVDLRQTYLTLLGSQVAGFYDTETRLMNVIPTLSGGDIERLNLTEQIIFVHEFVHALQDQHFGLDAFIKSTGDDLDAQLAALALVEGDATAVMQLYITQVSAASPAAALQLLAEGVLAGNLFLPPGIPPILTRELSFPYENGLAFVLQLWRSGGWDRVNAAYGDPPTTTEQILHPEKYLAGEGAIPVELDALSFGADCALVWETTLGEFYLGEHLRSGLRASEAARAAVGWGGDRLKLYDCSGAAAWMLRIVWDTPADAEEFTAAYEALAALRYSAERVDGCWRDASSALCLNVTADGHTIQYTQAR